MKHGIAYETVGSVLIVLVKASRQFGDCWRGFSRQTYYFGRIGDRIGRHFEPWYCCIAPSVLDILLLTCSTRETIHSEKKLQISTKEESDLPSPIK